MSTNQLAELDRQSRAFAGSGQEQYLRSFTWAVDRVLGPASTSRGQVPSVPSQHYDVNLLETPWSLDGRSETSTKTRVVDRNRKLVALVVCEDVAELLVSLINRTPEDQITTDL